MNSKECFGENLQTTFKLIFPIMNTLELGVFGPTAEILDTLNEFVNTSAKV